MIVDSVYPYGNWGLPVDLQIRFNNSLYFQTSPLRNGYVECFFFEADIKKIGENVFRHDLKAFLQTVLILIEKSILTHIRG